LEYTIDESRTKSLVESGDLLPANAWEEADFSNRSNDNHSENEVEYNYDNSSDDESDDDAASVAAGGATHFIDRPLDEPPSNLIELTHLHEPSVVNALRHRYQHSKCDMSRIYTDTGPILLAVNPFKIDETGKLYGEACAEQYRESGERGWLEKRQGENGGDERQRMNENEEPLGPHVYAVADRTFRTMMTRLHPMDSTGNSTATVNNTNVRNPGIHTATSQNTEKINQSVLVSGESGAGKTVTTKLLMRYLARLSERPANEDSSTATPHASLLTTSDNMSIERRVLESNPIMESFGNARTIRNDNSSRFGKYIEMKFSATNHDVNSTIDSANSNTRRCTGNGRAQQHSSLGATLIGASIETYLLEKVRLVHQSPGERNYHIFYELFTLKYEDEDYNFLETVVDPSQEEKEENHDHSMYSRKDIVDKFGLSQYGMEDFALINSSGTYDRRDGVSDASTFADLCRAMSVMGFKREEQIDVFAATAALLHASNLSFKRIGEQECALEHSFHLDCVVDLLGISMEGLNQALCYYEIVVRGEAHRKVLSKEQARKGVEALIKATYGTMFVYLVGRINASVSGGEMGGKNNEGARGRRGESSLEASIGILDIFGFESFQSNSFEQLCINYCNEALQQQFNRFVLRNEQEEYNREGIPWSYIEFPENQDVLDLIDLKASGILNVLHDQCRTPGSSDKSFSLQMYEKCSSHPRFEATSRQVAQQLFGVHHYAGLVEYSVDGFVEKNRDELPKEGADLLLSSSKGFVKTIATEMLRHSLQSVSGKKQLTSTRGGSSQRPSVGIQFSAQLHDLRRKIDETSPHCELQLNDF
jgi:myosin-5